MNFKCKFNFKTEVKDTLAITKTNYLTMLINLFYFDGLRLLLEDELSDVVERCFHEQMQSQRTNNNTEELFKVVLQKTVES